MAKAKQTQAEEPATIRVAVHSIDPETKEPYFAASSKGKEVVRLYGEFYVRIPADQAAAEQLCAGASTTFVGEDGKPVKITGPLAPLCRKYYGDLTEPQRGRLRDAAEEGIEVTSEEFQGWLDEAQPYTGRGGGFRKPEVSEAELKTVKASDLAAFLAKKGIKITD